MTKKIKDHFLEAQMILEKFLADDQNILAATQAAEQMVQSLKVGGKILSCGNGGSLCDAMHFAEEMTGRYRENRPPLAAICLSDASHMSCVSNDYGYDFVFERMVTALGKKEDVLLCISTSGNSKNVLLAAEKAKKIGMKIIALTGNQGGKLAALADVEVRVPHQGYADRIQEIHIKIIHSWIDFIETHLK